MDSKYSEHFCFECDMCGCSRGYKTAGVAKREAQKHGKRCENKIMTTYVDVYKLTFNPYSKSKIAHYEY